MTDIKLINENGVIKGIDPDTGEEVPVSFEELSTGVAFTDPVTMYVRSGGDDSNDGLSASDAKATIQAGVDDAPLVPNGGQALKVDIGDGTFSESVTLDRSVASQVWLQGSDSTTLDGSDPTTPKSKRPPGA
ncbi:MULTISPECIES: hypothetical protein [Halolamina]|uniref:Uncharacterized protein n=1 Tax=Halolamina pelagica TaxID=699431 RepID=A0A1I5U4D7_9EURY|nr:MULTISPECIES: hypothetical protein [Halolamina]NHX36760.1 hypothetical protein [Halolamina sp. R1-12]SFP89406.1 hypothetical protein SAMN05216277_11176 [Halolamina pelagica]